MGVPDIVNSEEFDVNKTTDNLIDKGFNEIYFLPGGEKYWIFEGWTNGLLFIHYGGAKPDCYVFKRAYI